MQDTRVELNGVKVHPFKSFDELYSEIIDKAYNEVIQDDDLELLDITKNKTTITIKVTSEDTIYSFDFAITESGYNLFDFDDLKHHHH